VKKIVFIFLGIVLKQFVYAQFGHDYWIAGSGNVYPSIPLGYFNNFSSNNQFVFDTTIKLGFHHTNASINRTNGELLFYSNGKQVANRNHDIMPNGDSLYNYQSQWDLYFTGNTTPQGALILPFPGDTNLFYLFHVSHNYSGILTPPQHLFYSVIDMRLNNGLGDLILKNQVVLSDSLWTGFLTATRHANGRDWWLISNRFRTNHFYSILFSPSGFQIFEQDCGPSLFTQNVGSTNFSPNGEYFAYYDWYHDLQLYHFDRCTGQLSNLVQITIDDTASCGGFAFSPNSRFGYITSCKYVYQIDLQATDIAASRIKVASNDYFVDPEFGWQVSFYLPVLAPDNKIYIIGSNSVKYLHTIESPDFLGLGCNVQQHNILLPTANVLTIPNRVNFNLGPITGSACDSLMTVKEEVIQNIHTRFFPNPFNSELQIVNFDEANNSKLIIYNAIGMVVFDEKLVSKNTTVDLSSLSQGIYRACILNNSGHFVKNEKLVKVK
jgi:hypothetical protein